MAQAVYICYRPLLQIRYGEIDKGNVGAMGKQGTMRLFWTGMIPASNFRKVRSVLAVNGPNINGCFFDSQTMTRNVIAISLDFSSGELPGVYFGVYFYKS